MTCKELGSYAGDATRAAIVTMLCTRTEHGLESTVSDIQDQTGIAMFDVFSALRKLEHETIIDMVDDPSDPFGAKVSLRQDGVELLKQRAAA